MQKENLFEQAKALINDFTATKKVSRNKLSTRFDISGAMLSHIDNGHIDKISEDMLRNIISQLKPSGEFKIVATSNFNTVHGICKKAQASGQLCALIGYTGAGKSTALFNYFRSTENVYYLECKNSMNRKQFLNALLLEMGINYMGSVYEMIKLIIQQLNSQHRPLVIIDEAGKLSTNILLDLHDIRNATFNNAGIILAGCEYFKKNIEKAVTKEKTGYPEFYSRILSWTVLNKPTRQEMETICQMNGITSEVLINDFKRLPNYRLLYNAITNERGQTND